MVEKEVCGATAVNGTRRRAGGGTAGQRQFVPFSREQGGAREEEKGGWRKGRGGEGRDGGSSDVGTPCEEFL